MLRYHKLYWNVQYCIYCTRDTQISCTNYRRFGGKVALKLRVKRYSADNIALNGLLGRFAPWKPAESVKCTPTLQFCYLSSLCGQKLDVNVCRGRTQPQAVGFTSSHWGDPFRTTHTFIDPELSLIVKPGFMHTQHIQVTLKRAIFFFANSRS